MGKIPGDRKNEPDEAAGTLGGSGVVGSRRRVVSDRISDTRYVRSSAPLVSWISTGTLGAAQGYCTNALLLPSRSPPKKSFARSLLDSSRASPSPDGTWVVSCAHERSGASFNSALTQVPPSCGVSETTGEAGAWLFN